MSRRNNFRQSNDFNENDGNQTYQESDPRDQNKTSPTLSRRITNRVSADDMSGSRSYRQSGGVSGRSMYHESIYTSGGSTYRDGMMSRSLVEAQEELDMEANRRALEKGFMVKVFRNGNSFFKGYWCSVSLRQFPSLTSFMDHLNKKIDTDCGVNFLFKYGSGKLVTDIKQLSPGGLYVASSTKRYKRIEYASIKDLVWAHGQRPKSPYPNSERGTNSTLSPRKRNLRFTLLDYSDWQNRKRCKLQPHAYKDFEEFMENEVKTTFPEAGKICSRREPRIDVSSFSQLCRLVERGIRVYLVFKEDRSSNQEENTDLGEQERPEIFRNSGLERDENFDSRDRENKADYINGGDG